MKITLEKGQTWFATNEDSQGRKPCRYIKRVDRSAGAGYVVIEHYLHPGTDMEPSTTTVGIPAMKAWIASRNARLEV